MESRGQELEMGSGGLGRGSERGTSIQRETVHADHPNFSAFPTEESVSAILPYTYVRINTAKKPFQFQLLRRAPVAIFLLDTR